MKLTHSIIYLGLAVAFYSNAGTSWAKPVASDQEKNLLIKKDDPKYKFHEASSLSGIHLKSNKSTGTFILQLDQHLPEAGLLQIKNTAGKILYSNTLLPSKTPQAHTLDVGKLNPGLYAIEVKTSDATFWKKVRIYK